MSAAAFTPQRRRRGRIIVVSEDGGGVMLHATDERIQRASNLFEALGIIAHATAASPVEAVVVTTDACSSPLEAIAEAVHSVDPAVLLYLALAAPADDEALHEAASDAGFDGVIPAPLTIAMLRALLHEDGVRVHHASAEESHDAEEHEASAQPPREAARPTAASIASEPALTAPPPPPPLPRRKPQPQPDRDRATSEIILPAPQTATLGDSDLVEAILEAVEPLAPLALRLIVQETGWKDIRLAPEASEANDRARAAAAVTHGDESFGFLQRDAGSAADLEPWATWLANWLALRSRMAALEAQSNTDPLTGAWNRRYFETFLPEAIDRARSERRALAIVAFDVDDLKHYNDRYGHDAGDDVLCETVALVQSMIRKGDRVCRIGGDEFVIIFADPEPPRKPGSAPLESIEALVRRFQEGICRLEFTKLGAEAAGPLSISAGMAMYPWDGADPDTLLAEADRLALESKRRGKNTLTIGPAAVAACERINNQEDDGEGMRD